MKIVIIGSGKVANWFGKILHQNRHEIIQVYSRNIENASILASDLNAEPIDNLQKINTTANLYLIAVADNAVEEILVNISGVNGILINTSGSMNISDMKNKSANYGIMWPMISVTKDMKPENDFIMVIEASDSSTENKLKELSSLFTEKVYSLSYEQRKALHLSAVFSNNFTNHLISIAQQLLEKNDIDPSVLQPMLENMIERLKNSPAKELQSGPALRDDTIVMQNHLQMLKDHPDLQSIYKSLSKSIRNSYKKSN